jgi:hypothetical protein
LSDLLKNISGVEVLSFINNGERIQKMFSTEIRHYNHSVLYSCIASIIGQPNKIKLGREDLGRLKLHYDTLIRIYEELSNCNYSLLSNKDIHRIKQEAKKALIIKGYDNSELVNILIEGYE